MQQRPSATMYLLAQLSKHCRMIMLTVCAALMGGLLTSTSAIARPHVAFDSSSELDRQIASTLHSLAVGDLSRARLFARQLAWRFPDFALGQLLSAELESTAAFRDVTIAQDGQLDKQLVDLLLEAQARLNTPQISDSRLLPAELIQLGSDVSQVLMVDLSQSTLFQFSAHHSAPTLVHQHYIGSGKAGYGKRVEGDNKTPLGVYRITGVRSDESLPDLYGSGALMLNYPNALDHHFGRTGSGIWLHGVPHSQRSRAPRSSEGCVTMSNDHFTRLQDRVTVSDSRVVLTDQINWITKTQQTEKATLFRELFGRYQLAWTSSDQTTLLELYGDMEQFGERIEPDLSELLSVKRSESWPAGSPPIRPLTTTKSQAGFLSALDSVNPNDISIFRSPSLSASRSRSGEHQGENYVVMSMRFGLVNEHQLTIYWEEDKYGQWRVVAEQLDGKSI